MRIDSAFPSDYIKAADLEGDVTYTIKSVNVEEIGQEKDRRPVVYFEETEKGLVLNKTNARTISEAYTLETDDWIGRQITLYERMVEFSGKEVPAIRVKVPRQRVAAGSRKAPQSFEREDKNEIPF